MYNLTNKKLTEIKIRSLEDNAKYSSDQVASLINENYHLKDVLLLMK